MVEQGSHHGVRFPEPAAKSAKDAAVAVGRETDKRLDIRVNWGESGRLEIGPLHTAPKTAQRGSPLPAHWADAAVMREHSTHLEPQFGFVSLFDPSGTDRVCSRSAPKKVRVRDLGADEVCVRSDLHTRNLAPMRWCPPKVGADKACADEVGPFQPGKTLRNGAIEGSTVFPRNVPPARHG